MICQVLFQFYQFSLPNILLQTNFKAALQFSGSLEHNTNHLLLVVQKSVLSSSDFSKILAWVFFC